jgi:uncharacterized membrane protein YdjX (TVP38/TMEM64 family)
MGGAPQASSSRPPRWFWGLLTLLLLGLAVMVLAAFLYYRGPLWAWTCHFYHAITDRERLQEFLRRMGPLAPLFFIIMQALQVVFAPIPGEGTGFVAGALFGIPLGFLYSTLGLTLGSALAFLLARWLEIRFVARWVGQETMDRFEILMEHQGALVAFFLFVVPGFPKDYLCFLLGLSHMSLRLFLVISTVGRLPGTFMLTLWGNQAISGHWLALGLSGGLCLVVGGTLYYFRQSLYEWVKRFDHGRVTPHVHGRSRKKRASESEAPRK